LVSFGGPIGFICRIRSRCHVRHYHVCVEDVPDLTLRGVYFKDYFDQPSRAQIGTMVAILEVGAFCKIPSQSILIKVSSLAVGRIGDIIGRRRTIWYGALIFVVGGLLQTCAWGMPAMIVGRIISGVGVGLLSFFSLV
jgi:MFS family permease